MGGNCEHSTALHIPGDLVILEVINPQTGEPVDPGDVGELVFTSLVTDTHPVIRYRSGDLGRLAPEPVCACGASWPRILNGIEGRADEMIWYKGVNIYPATVEQVVRSFPELTDEFRIILRGTYEYPQLVIQIESMANFITDTNLLKRVQAALESALGVHAQLELVPTGTLPRTEYKARRVVDERRID